MAGKRRASYQQGTIARVKRKKGPDVWVFRYLRYSLDGKRSYAAERIATAAECPTMAEAAKLAAKLRERVNERRICATFAGLCQTYRDDGMTIRQNTSQSYVSILNRFEDKWGKQKLDWMASRPQEIENWLRALSSVPRKGRETKLLSAKTLSNYKALLHRMFECAMKWGYLPMDRNPIDFVELRGLPPARKRKKKQPTPTIEQYADLIADPKLSEHVKVMVQIATMTGMRASEFLGLRRDEDLDFEGGVIRIQRSVVGKFEDGTKSEESEAEYPMHEDLAGILRAFMKSNPPVNGWLFGNAVTGRPFWRGSLQRDHLVPAGKRLGIPNLGWHGFRHAYRALQAELELPLEVQQHLMRHTRITTTMEYGKNSPYRKRKLKAANARIVEMLPR